MPSVRVKFPSYRKIPAIKVATNNATVSVFNRSLRIGIGQITAVSPKTRPIFARLEPIAFPIPISPASLKAALIDTIISGADVPMETIVRHS